MRQYEYNHFVKQPAVAMSAELYNQWFLETLNQLGAEGWIVTSTTPYLVNNQPTGQIGIMAYREKITPELAPKLQ